MTYEHLKLPNFEKTLHEPFMAASISGHLSLQCPWVPKILFALPESILVKIEPLYALVFRMQAVRTTLFPFSRFDSFLIEKKIPHGETNFSKLMIYCC